jgi:hypothetical protein
MDKDFDMIPIQELEDLLVCRQLKDKYIREQNYEDAAKMRDLEKIIFTQHPHLPYVETNKLFIYLRERKINQLLK